MTRSGRGPIALASSTLAAGVLAATCVFTAVNGVLLRPAPYGDPDRVLRLWESHPSTGRTREGVSPLNHRDWSEASRAFEAIALWELGSMALRGAGDPIQVPVVHTTANLFRLLGARPITGRALDPALDDRAVERPVMISEGLWMRAFGRDPNITSRSIFLNEIRHDIVGVMPRAFQFPLGIAVDVWAPLVVPAGEARVRAARRYQAVGRLADGATFQAAAAEMTAIAANLADAHPGSNEGWTISIASVADERRERAGHLLVLLACTGAVLLLGLVTASGLLAVVAMSRTPQAAVRAALGASRGRLARDSLVTYAAPAALAGVAGAVAGQLLAPWALAYGGGTLAGAYEIGVDWRVVLFALLISVGPAFAAGAGAVAITLRANPARLLVERSDVASVPRSILPLRRALTVAQVAVAVTLLSATALLARSFIRLLDQDPGFRADGVLVASLSLPSRQLNLATAEFYRDLIERLKTLPRVRSAAGVTALPMSPTEMDEFRLPYQIDGEPELADAAAPRIQFRACTPGYFSAIGRRLLAGRDFTGDDGEPSAPLRAIVSETVALRHFAQRDPLGARIRLPFGGWHEIIGVAGDVRFRGLDDSAQAEIYLPYRRRPFPTVNLVIRTDGDPAGIAGDVRAAIRAADPNLPIPRLAPLADLVSDTAAVRRFALIAVAALAVIAWAVSVAGTYGLVAQAAIARRGELGIRAALGATPGSLVRMLVVDGFAAASVGAIAGLALSMGSTPVLAGLLYRTSPTDWKMLTAAGGLQLATAAISAWMPAAAAAREDPSMAMRIG